MTTYKEIRGTNIEVLASDPSNPVLGQVWYNSTSDVVKAQSFNSGSWATSGNMDTGRRDLAGAGTQTAALGFGGQTSPGTIVALTETYNGSAWSEVSDLNNARQ